MMKAAASFLAAITAVALMGCGDQKQAANPEPTVPVQGQAINRLEPEAPAAKPAPEPVPATTNLAAAATTPAPESITPPAKPAKTTVEETVIKVAKNTTAKSVEEATTPAPQPELIDGEFLSVGFDKLSSFEYEVPEEEYDPDKQPDPTQQTNQIPAEIKAFNKKRVALKGFMLPLKVEDGNITELLIMRDQSMCCYGTVPKINEWVSVKMTGKGIKPIMDQAVTIYGRLKVGEIRENGYLVGIYEMDGEKMTGPLDL